MRIAIESSVLQRRDKTGVDYFALGLISEVITQMPEDEFYLCYFDQMMKQPNVIKNTNVRLRRLAVLPPKIYYFFFRKIGIFPYDLAMRVKPNIFFFPNFTRWPLLFGSKSVILVHDTAYLDMPEVVDDRNRRYLERAVPSSILKSSQVIVNSDSTKNALIKHYKTPLEKITVINPAVDHTVFYPREKNVVSRVRAKYAVHEKYILFVGTLEPRKNIRAMVEGYLQLPNELRSKYQLVLAGGKGWLDSDILALIKNAPLDQVVRLGYVPLEDLPALYSGAEVFLYPSRYEGWGMPVLEAMACGCRVLTAQNSSLKEVGGMAAAYVDSEDSRGVARGLEKLINEPTKDKNSRIRSGIEHALKFNWQNAGSLLAEVFRRVETRR